MISGAEILEKNFATFREACEEIKRFFEEVKKQLPKEEVYFDELKEDPIAKAIVDVKESFNSNLIEESKLLVEGRLVVKVRIERVGRSYIPREVFHKLFNSIMSKLKPVLTKYGFKYEPQERQWVKTVYAFVTLS